MMKRITQPRVIVAQQGSREYFLAARALHRKGLLRQLVVDWYAPFYGNIGRTLEGAELGILSRAFAAYSEELPRNLVKAMYLFGIYDRIYDKCIQGKAPGWKLLGHPDNVFSKRLGNATFPDHDVFFGYSYTSLEALMSEKAKGRFTVLDQIDASMVGHEILKGEEEKWGHYLLEPIPDFTDAYHRNRNEWLNSDIIIVNSEWSKECIINRGCPPDRVAVLPLAYEGNRIPIGFKESPPPLKVLWLGRISLGKGIQYLIEAARLLANEPVEFRVAGRLEIRREVVDNSPSNIKWLGYASGRRKDELYNSSHVFVLPTLSDGFAITQLEAFSHGLPVIATNRCGRVIEPGQTGLLVRPADPEDLAEAILQFIREPSLSKVFGSRCAKAIKSYSVDVYANGLAEIIKGGI